MKAGFFLMLTLTLFINGCSKNNHTTTSPNSLIVPTPIQESPTPNDVNTSPDLNSSQAKDITPTTSMSSFMEDIIAAAKSESITPLAIDENSYYVIGENNWFETSANITIINNQKEIVRTFKQAILDWRTIGKINKNIPIIIGVYDFSKIITYNDHINSIDKGNNGVTNSKYGLYLPGKDTFLIEPIYNLLIPYDDNIMGGFIKDEILFLNKNGDTLFGPISSNDVTVTFMTNTIWLISKTKPTYVYDKNFNLLKEFDSSKYDFYSYGDDFIYTRNKDEIVDYNQQIYDSYGTLILSKEILLEQSDIPTDILSTETDINFVYRSKDIPLFQVSIGSYHLLLDDNYHVIDTINTLETPDYNFFTLNNHYSKYNYTNKNEVILHRADGTIVLDERGQSFNEAISDTIFSGIHDNVIILYNSITKESYSITLKNYTSPSLTYLTPDLFYVTNSEPPYLFCIYYKDKLILESPNYEYTHIIMADGYFAIREMSDFNNEFIYTIIDSLGNVKYTSPYKETLLTGDKDYLLVRRGNYIGLVDYNGDFVYKVLVPSLIDN
jgi:hypothetical protein